MVNLPYKFSQNQTKKCWLCITRTVLTVLKKGHALKKHYIIAWIIIFWLGLGQQWYYLNTCDKFLQHIWADWLKICMHVLLISISSNGKTKYVKQAKVSTWAVWKLFFISHQWCTVQLHFITSLRIKTISKYRPLPNHIKTAISMLSSVRNETMPHISRPRKVMQMVFILSFHGVTLLYHRHILLYVSVLYQQILHTLVMC